MNHADFIKSEQACAAEKAAAYPFIWRQLATLGWQSYAGKVPGEKDRHWGRMLPPEAGPRRAASCRLGRGGLQKGTQSGLAAAPKPTAQAPERGTARSSVPTPPTRPPPALRS